MANNFESNFTREVMKKTLAPFQSSRVLSKNVNTQLFAGKFNPDSGTVIDVKRPTDYTAQETADGDISTTRQTLSTVKHLRLCRTTSLSRLTMMRLTKH